MSQTLTHHVWEDASCTELTRQAYRTAWFLFDVDIKAPRGSELEKRATRLYKRAMRRVFRRAALSGFQPGRAFSAPSRAKEVTS